MNYQVRDDLECWMVNIQDHQFNTLPQLFREEVYNATETPHDDISIVFYYNEDAFEIISNGCTLKHINTDTSVIDQLADSIRKEEQP